MSIEMHGREALRAEVIHKRHQGSDLRAVISATNKRHRVGLENFAKNSCLIGKILHHERRMRIGIAVVDNIQYFPGINLYILVKRAHVPTVQS